MSLLYFIVFKLVQMDFCNCNFKHDDIQDSLNHGKSFVVNMFSTGLLKYFIIFPFSSVSKKKQHLSCQ